MDTVELTAVGAEKATVGMMAVQSGADRAKQTVAAMVTVMAAEGVRLVVGAQPAVAMAAMVAAQPKGWTPVLAHPLYHQHARAS